MEVGVRVEAENILTGERRHTNTCFLTFVAIDEEGAPVPVPPLELESEEERQRFREAKRRRQVRHELAREFEGRSSG
jgi:acyl-CoA hydrolase